MKEFFKNANEIFKNLKATPKGKAVLFFGFYLVFFIILFVLASVGSSDGSGEYDKADDVSYNLELIEKNNYKYKYTNTIDLDSISFEGERYKNNSLYKFNNIYYFSNIDKVYYNNSNNLWVESVDPNTLSYFTDINNIKEILDKSTYVSTTDYKSGKEVYNYEISTTTLVKLINNLEVDLDDKSNGITLSTDEEKNVNKISFVLDSYGVYNKICKMKLSIELEYDDFGKIKEIESPIK